MRPSRLVRNMLCCAFLFSVIVAILGVSVGLAFVKREASTLPAVSSLQAHTSSMTSKLLASDDSVIGQFAEQNRVPVGLDQIPAHVVQAFVSAEDRSFWHHQGVDPIAVTRAALFDLRNRKSGKRPLGASTITQQVIKNMLAGDERTLRRKIREAILAIRLEREIGKRRVIELYLNEIYLGYGAYGVAAAADAYFGKPLQSLTLPEAAFLAALPKGPSNYDPIRRPEAALARRSYVLGRMQDDGAITAEQAQEARQAPLPRPSQRSLGGVAEGYFPEDVRRDVIDRFGSAALYKSGLIVHTSMDPRIQALADKSLRDGLIEYDQRHGWRGPLDTMPREVRLSDPNSWVPALLSLEPPAGSEDWRLSVVLGFNRDGAVVGFADGHTAILGSDGVRWARRVLSRGMGPTPRRPEDILHLGDVILTGDFATKIPGRVELKQIPAVEGALVAIEVSTGRVLAISGGFSHERSSFDRVTQSKRQPGSTFKPFIYLDAFEHGYDATSPLLDMPIAIDTAPGAQRWRPAGEGGWGMITARRALENSRNFASVRLLYDLGLDSVAEVTRRFGIYDDLPNFADALGAKETTDMKITAAYAMMANGGHRIVPSLIDRIESPDQTVLFNRENLPDTPENRVADPIAAAQLVSVLEGVVRRGTAAPALSKIDLPIAGKTGTTNENHDAWFVGFTPELAVGVHVGFDKPDSLGESETGGGAAAPIFGSFIKQVVQIRPLKTTKFPSPEGILRQRFDATTGDPSPNGVEEILRDKSPTPTVQNAQAITTSRNPNLP